MKLLTLPEIRTITNGIADEIQDIRFSPVMDLTDAQLLINTLGGNLAILNTIVTSLAEEIYGKPQTGNATSDASGTDGEQSSGSARRR